MDNIQVIAHTLFDAHKKGKALPRFTAGNPDFAIEHGYQVQRALLALHEASGARLVGRKMGMTSRAKMQQMKIDAPIHGFLTREMEICEGGELILTGRIHPKVEPEIAFITGRELRGRPSAGEALASVDGVLGALEIIDSRFENYDFELPDVVADNCSSSGFVCGNKILKPSELSNLENLGILLEVNGKAAQFGSSAAILGNPARSLADLVALLDAEGLSLPAGSLVLAGGATAAVPLKAGDFVRAEFQGLGSAEFRVRA